MKKYENPMLHVVSINKQDIIVTSGEGVTTGSALGNEFNSSDVSYSSGRRFDSWEEGF